MSDAGVVGHVPAEQAPLVAGQQQVQPVHPSDIPTPVQAEIEEEVAEITEALAVGDQEAAVDAANDADAMKEAINEGDTSSDGQASSETAEGGNSTTEASADAAGASDGAADQAQAEGSNSTATE